MVNSQANNIVIGSRASPLALAQTMLIRSGLEAAHHGLVVDIKTMTTSGDKFLEANLSAIGGKALFTKELDNALLQGDIDLAVHSLKDVETNLQAQLQIIAIPRRETPLDCLVSHGKATLASLKPGSVVGTASLRRQALIKKHRPDLVLTLLRGNINSRLQKLEQGEMDAMVLAVAGLKRVGLEHRISEVFSAEDFPPAPSQGALGLMALSHNESIKKICAPLHDAHAARAVELERKFLALLDGSCKTPIGCLVEIDGKNLRAIGFVANQDLSNPRQKIMVGELSHGDKIITALAQALR